MAQAKITTRWADGTEVECEVYADDSFPDSIAQVCHEVLLLHRASNTDEAETD